MSAGRDSVFGDTVNPELVTVGCDRCGDTFTTDESTALHADRHDEELLCDDCEAGGQPAPPQEELEEPTVDEVRDDVDVGVGPDAEPDIEATLPEFIGFNELNRPEELTVELTRGTEEVGTITVTPGEPSDFSLPVHLDPSPVVLSDEVAEEVISALSCRTNYLIDVQ